MNRYTITYTDGKTETVDADRMTDQYMDTSFVVLERTTDPAGDGVPAIYARKDQIRSIALARLTDEQLAAEAGEKAEQEELNRYHASYQELYRAFEFIDSAVADDCWQKGEDPLTARANYDGLIGHVEHLKQLTFEYLKKRKECAT